MPILHRAVVFVVLFTCATAVVPTAYATPKPLKALDQRVQDYHVELIGDPAEDKERIVAAMEALDEIIAEAEALDEKHRARGLLRTVEAYLRLADGLLAAPCPDQLSPDVCLIYKGKLAEIATELAHKATATATSLDYTGQLNAADRRRFEELVAAGSDTVDRAAMAILQVPQEGAAPTVEPVAAVVSDEDWAPPPAEADADTQFVLLWGNADLYRSPDDPAPLRAYDYADADRLQHPDALYVAPILNEGDGGRLEVRLGGQLEWDRHCVGSNLMPYWTAVRVWIDRDDQVEVLAKEVVVEHEDGTGVRLMPGTPLVGDQAWLHGQLVPVPADAIRAASYPGDSPRLEAKIGGHTLPWNTEGHIGGQLFSVRQPDYQYGDAWFISNSTPTDGGSLVALNERCGQVRFLLEGTEPTPYSAFAGMFGNTVEDGDQVQFPAGTRLYWIDGTPAGVMVQARNFAPSQVYGEQMRCVDQEIVSTLRTLPATTVPLCARPGDVQ